MVHISRPWRESKRLRWIPAGEFVMGAATSPKEKANLEQPQHSVQIAKGFWLFDTPCTQMLWMAVMGRSTRRPSYTSHPIEQVNWSDVRAFIERLNGLLVGLTLSLPTEAHWEYACRAGSAMTYPSDTDHRPLADHAWFVVAIPHAILIG